MLFKNGEYGAAKTLLASALSFEPSHVDVHALLAQAFRGLGDPSGAAYHLRMWLYARPDAADGERAVRYLKRYQQPTELHLSSSPAADEKAVRVARLLRDVDNAGPSPDATEAEMIARRNAMQTPTTVPNDPDAIAARRAGLR